MRKRIMFTVLGLLGGSLGLLAQACARPDGSAQRDIASDFQGQNSWTSCSIEDHLNVFRRNYSALQGVNDFEARLVPDLRDRTSTLFLTYTYENKRWVAIVKLNKECGELDHGATNTDAIEVFGSH